MSFIHMKSSLTLSFKIINMNLTWGHLRSLRSKMGSKFWTILNGKTNTAKVLVGVKHQKVSTVTSSPDLWLTLNCIRGVKGQKRSNRKQREMIKVTLSMCSSSRSNIKKSPSPRWPLHPTYGKEVKGQKSQNWVKFWTILNGKTVQITLPNGCDWSGKDNSNIKKCPGAVTSSPDLWLRGQRSKKVKSQTTWNDKSNTVNVLILVKHQKSPRWPLHPTYGKEVKGQKRSNLKQLQMTRVALSMYLSLPNIKKCTRWPLRVTNGWGCWHLAYMKSVCNNPFIWATVKGSKM